MGLVDRLGPFKLTATGLEVQGKPSFAQWQKAGAYLQLAAGAVQWWLGDWMNYGEGRWGERYAQAIEATGLDEGTLRNIAWVCRRFDPSRRHDKVSFAHHQEVASLPPDRADELLELAASGGLVKRELRELARGAKPFDLATERVAVRAWLADRLASWPAEHRAAFRDAIAAFAEGIG